MILFLSVAVVALQPVYAAWQYTDWDMTPEEVVEASGGKAELSAPEEARGGLTELVRGSHKAGLFSFQVSFLFQSTDSEKVLSRVVLTLKDQTNAPQLYQSLVGTYGTPVSEEINSIEGGESHVAQWRDMERNNVITYYGIGRYYVVEYGPLNRSANGL